MHREDSELRSGVLTSPADALLGSTIAQTLAAPPIELTPLYEQMRGYRTR